MSAMRRASSAAGAPGRTPQRLAPRSISTIAPSSTPKSRATRPVASTCSALSKQSATRASAASAARRRSFLLPDHLVADQHVLDAAADERFRLAHLLAALADGARRDLLQRDRRTFVRLGVRPETHARLLGEGGELGEVALERVELDDESRRLDRVDRVADGGEVLRSHLRR